MTHCTNTPLTHSIFQPSKTVLRVGRGNDCEVFIDDNMLSRVHCSIEYRDNTWVVRDGVVKGVKDGRFENKFSTNGTWYG
jgi:pSer/pThr/pTyr-binding forkhead associated (FHA) protein